MCVGVLFLVNKLVSNVYGFCVIDSNFIFVNVIRQRTDNTEDNGRTYFVKFL